MRVYCNTRFVVLLCAVLLLLPDVFGQPGDMQPLTLRQLDSLSMMGQYQRLVPHIRATPWLPSPQISAKKNRPALPVDAAAWQRNLNCRDTSARFFLQKDSAYYYVSRTYKAADGNYLLSGEYLDLRQPFNFASRGFLMKADGYGNLLWAKLYDSLGRTRYDFINYYQIIELKDGSLLLAGGTANLPTQNNELILTKTDQQGNITWNRIYRSRFWIPGSSGGSADYYYVQQMVQDTLDGDVYITGPHWNEGRSIFRLDEVTGNIVWSKMYQHPQGASFDRPFGIDIRGNEIRSIGRWSDFQHTPIAIYRINKTNGDTIQTRFYTVTDTPRVKQSFLSNLRMQVLSNGNYALSGTVFGQYEFQYNGLVPLYQAAVTEFDGNLNFVKSYSFRNRTESNSYNTLVTVRPDGSGLFSMLQYFSGYTANIFYTQFQNGNILKSRIRFYTGEGLPVASPMQLWQNGMLLITGIGDSAYRRTKIEFLKLHVTDTASACLGQPDNETFTQDFRYAPAVFSLDSIGNDVFYLSTQKTIVSQNDTLNYVPGCEQVSFCDTLKLRASDDTICATTPLLLTVHKNRQCGARPQLSYNSAVVQSITAINDSTYSILFNQTWQGYIYATLPGCALLKDSVPVRVLATPPPLNLGPDTTLCTGNTILLSAQNGYATYLWNTGATTPAISIATPGTYYVTTRDGCNNIASDTIRVLAAPGVNIDIGPDRQKCNADTLQLRAPAGYISYAWGPAYNINTQTGPQVVVNPATDTIYFVRAEKTPGCFAFDTLRVKVNTSPPISLGADRNLCQRDTLRLDAGPGFVQYNWNTGAGSQAITVAAAGAYTVTATTAQNCRSTDTLLVLNVFALPVVTLNPDTTLCMGAVRTPDAGPGFVSYLWNTGATTAAIPVATTGTYWVQVTDANQCKGGDTVRITRRLPLPAQFLPGDTAICSYSILQLQPSRSFNQYLWSTGATSPAITISQPGLYWLEVKDNNNCTGKDTVTVMRKDCIKGIYFPSGFTPNGDGKNDRFKPLVFGNIRQYSFTIYNRWGEIVFATTQPEKGWDGKVKGFATDSGIFVWRCTYQFEGEPVFTEKGNLTLIR